MKAILTLVMAFSLSQVFAQMSGTPAPATGVPAAGPSTTTGLINTNPNQPVNGTINGNRGMNNNLNNTNTTTDTIGTSQSSTTRRVLPNTPGTVTPANSNATGVNCVDSSGRNYGNGETGYTACVNSMRTR